MLLSMKMVYTGRPKKGSQGSQGPLGRRAWKTLFALISKGFFVLVKAPLRLQGPVHQEKFNEDQFVAFPDHETKEKQSYIYQKSGKTFTHRLRFPQVAPSNNRHRY